jgi:cell division protease FtsH
MVARYGMCQRLGTVSYLSGGEVFIGRDYQTTKGYSEMVAGSIDSEVKLLVDEAYAHCEKILRENEDKLKQVAAYLLEHETMTGAQFRACMAGESIPEDNSDTVFFAELEDDQ